MADDMRLTEAILRRVMRDDRYWKAWHPERLDFTDWVTNGWRALTATRTRTVSGEAVVQVRAYERTRKGVIEKVAAHTRAAPDGRLEDDSLPGSGPPNASDDLETPTGRSRRRDRPAPPLDVTPRLPNGARGGGTDGVDQGPQPKLILPSWMGGRGGRGAHALPVTPGQFQVRKPGLSGAEAANDGPSRVRGRRPYVNETPEDFARRMMNEQYPEGWYQKESDLGGESEFSQIKKYARGFRNSNR